MSETCVIVGAGHAGGRAAEALRGHGYAGRIMLIGAEPHLPYERPPLSKELLVKPDVAARPIRNQAWYDSEGIELVLGDQAVDLDTSLRRLGLAGGREIRYDRLLLCMGGRVRRLDLPGSDLSGILYLRTIDESRRIASALSPGARVVIVGAGFIGLEVASSACKRGAEVWVLEATDRLMGRAVPAEVGMRMLGLHRDHGVDIRLGTGLVAFEGNGVVEAVRLADGTHLAADIVVVGVGILPATDLAEHAGITVDNGILTNEYCRTSAEGVYACGDVTSHFNPRLGRRLRLESWHNAQQQAIAAAHNLAGIPKVYDDVPWFWTDQHGVNLQILGVPQSWEEAVRRGDSVGEEFSLFRVEDGEVTGAITVNRPRDMAVAKRLMAAHKPVDENFLADPEADLRRLLR